MLGSTRFAFIAFSAATLFSVAACTDSTGAAMGTLSVRLTNASVAASIAASLASDSSAAATEAPLPAGSVKSVDIFVVRIDAKAKEETDDDAAQDTEEAESAKDGWVTVAEPNASFDLMKLADGTNTFLGDA